ncbi:MAG: enoyl-CoA hydratase/isomerase family protein [Actinobacteria bacterium]|nr:enoyl-CoA hydratase/isomerase family protein [Actinomycetota bacterium]
MTIDETIRYQVADGAATITIDNPARRNVLDAGSIGGMRQALATAAADESVRVVVLTGSGNTFCAGADLAGATSADAESFAGSGPRALVGLLEDILDHPKPTIAKVAGHVAGGGNGLVAACDLAVAADTAKFAFSEVRVGVAPAVISTVCLAKLHPADAYELLLTGERVPAERVLRAGMINRVVPAEAIEAEVAALIGQLAMGGPQALAATKELLRKVPTMSRTEAFGWTADLSAQLFSSDEARAGMTAFLSKSSPPWAPTSG